MEARENQIFMLTITHVKYNESQSGEKEYQFRCDDMKDLLARNPALRTKHHKIANQKNFPCSADIIRLLAFNIVQS